MSLLQGLSLVALFLLLWVACLGLLLIAHMLALRTLEYVHPGRAADDGDVSLLATAYMILAGGTLLLASVVLR